MKPVICCYCNTEIYHYTGPVERIDFRATNFTPSNPKFKTPQAGQPLACPHCAIKFVGFSHQNNQIRMLIDWHYKGTGEIGKAEP